jgi:hypothetical protein
MEENTTIAISKGTRDRLDGIKIHEREPYGEVVERLLDVYEKKNEMSKKAR